MSTTAGSSHASTLLGVPASRLSPQLAQIARDHAFRNSLGEGAWVMDEDGLLIELNPAAEELLGWTAEELRGRSVHDAVHYLREDGSPYPADECPLRGVLRTSEEFAETSDTFVHRDGTLLPVAYVASPVVVEDQIVGVVLAFWPRP
jgi:two-component system sensor histidine kinase UhpB